MQAVKKAFLETLHTLREKNLAEWEAEHKDELEEAKNNVEAQAKAMEEISISDYDDIHQSCESFLEAEEELRSLQKQRKALAETWCHVFRYVERHA